MTKISFLLFEKTLPISPTPTLTNRSLHSLINDTDIDYEINLNLTNSDDYNFLQQRSNNNFDENSIELTLNTDKMLSHNEFLNNFEFLDQNLNNLSFGENLENLRQHMKNKLPNKITVDKNKIDLDRIKSDKKDPNNNPLLSSKLVDNELRRDPGFRKELFNLFGHSLGKGKKCCGHAPVFRLYNPDTDFCDRD